MITERKISIFDSTMQTITVPVNTFAIMGNGLALAFKNRYPTLYPAYVNACKDELFTKEGLFVFNSEDKRILCFPTKRHWKNPSKIEWIEEGLQLLSLHYAWYGIESISLPALGCGQGGLDYELVRALVYRYLDLHPLSVELIPQ